MPVMAALREVAATRMGDDMPMLRTILNQAAHYIELLESQCDWYAKRIAENLENA